MQENTFIMVDYEMYHFDLGLRARAITRVTSSTTEHQEPVSEIAAVHSALVCLLKQNNKQKKLWCHPTHTYTLGNHYITI